MGNGTTAVAALRLKCKFIEIEIDKERFENARHRVDTAIHELIENELTGR